MKSDVRSLPLLAVFILTFFGASWASPVSRVSEQEKSQPIQLAQAQEQVDMQRLQQELNETQQSYQQLRADEERQRQQQSVQGKVIKPRQAFHDATIELERVARDLDHKGMPDYYHGRRHQALLHIYQALKLIQQCEAFDRQHGCCQY